MLRNEVCPRRDATQITSIIVQYWTSKAVSYSTDAALSSRVFLRVYRLMQQHPLSEESRAIGR